MANKKPDTPPTSTDADTSKQPPSPTLPPTIKRHKNGKHEDDESYRKQVEKEKVKPPHWNSNVEAICAVALVLITAYYTRAAFRQAKASEVAANAAKSAAESNIDSVYFACLTAQATQATLIQVQKGANDSHASAVATVEQARAGMVSGQANISFAPRFPSREEVINHKVAIPYSLKNDGRSEATKMAIKVKAVLLKSGENLAFDETHLGDIKSERIPAGFEWPDKPPDARLKATTSVIPLKNNAGVDVSDLDSEGATFLEGGPNEAFVYGRMSYADAFGTHNATFCYSVFIMKLGTMRNPVPNDRKCAEHNQQNNEYTAIPKLDVPSPEKQTDATLPINCVKPASQ